MRPHARPSSSHAVYVCIRATGAAVLPCERLRLDARVLSPRCAAACARSAQWKGFPPQWGRQYAAACVQWEVLLVDEGHRLKNEHSRLAETLVALPARSRFLLTGTPLQNSLRELWALLHFLLPTVFACASTFDSWFASAFGRAEARSCTPATATATATATACPV
jgi:hypothetical protein